MAVITVSAGQPIRATHINQFSRWLTAQTKDITTSITSTHASEYTLNLTNEAATGNILKLGYGTGTAVAGIVSATAATFCVPTTFVTTVTFGAGLSLTSVSVGNGTITAPSISFSTDANTGRRWVSADYMEDVVGGESAIRYANGAEFPQIGIGNIDEPGPGGTANILHVHWQNSTNTQGNVIGVASEITNNSTSASGSVPGDFSAFSAFCYQTTDAANSAMRAFEGHVIATATGAGAHTNASIMAAELGVHCSNVGDGATKHVGIYLTSHNASGQTNATIADSAIYILGEAGWQNYLYCVNKATGVSFQVTNQGIVMGSTNANAAAPTYSWLSGAGFADKGMFSAGSGLVGMSAGGTEVMRFGATAVALTPGGSTQVLVGTTGAVVTGTFRVTGVSTLNGFTNAGAQVFTVLSPAVIATSTNDYAPAGGATASFIQLTSTASVNLTGFTMANTTGQYLTLVNIGGANIVLQHNNTGSAAANRINTHSSTDYTLASARAIAIYYTGSVWRTLAP